MSENHTFDQLIGKELRKIRKQNMKTLEEVAEMANLTAYHVGRIERGEKSQNLYTYYKLHRALTFSVDRMFDDIANDRNED